MCAVIMVDKESPGAGWRRCVEPGHEGGAPTAAPSMAAAGICLFIPAGIRAFFYGR